MELLVMSFIISNIEPFDTLHDAEVAAEKLGDDFQIFEGEEVEEIDGDVFDGDDLDEDEEEDLEEDED